MNLCRIYGWYFSLALHNNYSAKLNEQSFDLHFFQEPSAKCWVITTAPIYPVLETLKVDKLSQSPGTSIFLYMGLTKRNLSCNTFLQNKGLSIAVTTVLSTQRPAIVSWSKTPILCYIRFHCDNSILDNTHCRE